MMGKTWFIVEKIRRCVRTVFFMVAMVVSLLVSSLPVLVAISDVLVLSFLTSSFTCLMCYGVKEHLRRYSFKGSLTDIPLLSVLRSVLVICAYSLAEGPTLWHGPYLGTASLCSVVSILLILVKACHFALNSQMSGQAEASLYLSRQGLRLKQPWGLAVVFLASAVFALGHTVVAYRTSSRAKRKLLYHRVDPEAVLSCRSLLSSYQKVPRSPTPSVGKTSKIDSQSRRLPRTMQMPRDEGELSVRMLAEPDSLFITLRGGLTLHYKRCLPGSTLHSATSLEATSTCHHHRSYSSQINKSSLHVPLLDGCSPPPLLLRENKDENGLFGVVLVHGFGGGVFSWRHVMGSLAHQAGCVVAAFDRPGWGLTSRPQSKDWESSDIGNPYALESQVDMLLDFCNEMGFSSVVIVGHDDGGLLAMKAAERSQQAPNNGVEVKGVVLLNVSMSREVVPALARILMHASLGGKKHLLRPLLRTEIAQVVNRRAWYDATKLTADVLRLYKGPLHVQGWEEGLEEMGRVSHEMVLPPQRAESLLKAVQDLPVLVVAGAEDTLVPLHSSHSISSKLFNSRLVAISGCGHLPHEECPEALLAALSAFITSLVHVPHLHS